MAGGTRRRGQGRRQRLLKPRDLRMEVQRSASSHRLEGPRMMRGLTSPRGRRGNVGRTDTRPTENLSAPRSQTRPRSFRCFIQHPQAPASFLGRAETSGILVPRPVVRPAPPAVCHGSPQQPFFFLLPYRYPSRAGSAGEQTNLMQLSDPGLWL